MRNAVGFLCAVLIVVIASVALYFCADNVAVDTRIVFSDEATDAIFKLFGEGWLIRLDELRSPPTISKETTFVTEPVREDGMVDYFAAINRKFSEGVSVENNAAAWFAKAGIGLTDLNVEQRDEYCKMLEIETPTENEHWFKPLGVLPDDEQANLNAAASAPWSAAELPKIHDWIKSNELALDLIIKGSECSQCYIPLLPGTDDRKLMQASLAAQQDSRGVTACLIARAMQQLREGQYHEAQRDLLACHRLARFISNSPTLMSGLVGMVNDYRGHLADVAFLQNAQLSADDALSYQRQLRELRPFCSTADKLDYEERLVVLDSAASFNQNSTRLALMPESDKAKNIQDLRMVRDESLRVCNQRFDQFVAAARLPEYVDRKAAIDGLTSELQPTLTLVDELRGKTAKYAADLYRESPQKLGRQLGEIAVACLMPDIGAHIYQEQRMLTRHDFLQIGFALAAYHADNQTYPDSLEVLVPRYIDPVPRDRFGNANYQFIKSEDGYLLFSVGKNGIDDHGQTSEGEATADDIALQIEQ